jgi:hypothetical protein
MIPLKMLIDKKEFLLLAIKIVIAFSMITSQIVIAFQIFILNSLTLIFKKMMMDAY